MLKGVSEKRLGVLLSGAGSLKVENIVVDQLDLAISGAGDLTYYGNPQVDKKISGAGDVTQGGWAGACGS